MYIYIAFGLFYLHVRQCRSLKCQYQWSLPKARSSNTCECESSAVQVPVDNSISWFVYFWFKNSHKVEQYKNKSGGRSYLINARGESSFPAFSFGVDFALAGSWKTLFKTYAGNIDTRKEFFKFEKGDNFSNGFNYFLSDSQQQIRLCAVTERDTFETPKGTEHFEFTIEPLKALNRWASTWVGCFSYMNMGSKFLSHVREGTEFWLANRKRNGTTKQYFIQIGDSDVEVQKRTKIEPAKNQNQVFLS